MSMLIFWEDLPGSRMYGGLKQKDKGGGAEHSKCFMETRLVPVTTMCSRCSHCAHSMNGETKTQ